MACPRGHRLTPGRVLVGHVQCSCRGGHTTWACEILAELLAQLPYRRRRWTLPEPDTSSRLLFPGRTPTRPVDAGIFANRLKRHGINIRGGRNTALIRLASELPAAVLADLLGVDIATATRWAKYAKRDWHTYIAERRTGPESSNSTTLT